MTRNPTNPATTPNPVTTLIPREGRSVGTSATRGVHSNFSPTLSDTQTLSRAPSGDTSPSRDTPLSLETGVATGKGGVRGALVFNPEYGIGRTCQMGETWATNAGDVCVLFYGVWFRKHPPVLPILCHWTTLRTVPGKIAMFLILGGLVRVGTPEARDPNLLERLRRRQVSMVPDRRVFFDQPQHGFSSARGRLAASTPERLLPGLHVSKDGRVTVRQGSDVVDWRKDGPFMNVVDGREIEFEKRLMHTEFSDEPTPLRRNAHGTSECFPTPKSDRTRKVDWAREGISKDDVASGAVVFQGDRKFLNFMPHWQAVRLKERKTTKKTRQLANIAALLECGMNSREIAAELKMSGRTVRRRIAELGQV
jgi:hypothetical protein